MEKTVNSDRELIVFSPLALILVLLYIFTGCASIESSTPLGAAALSGDANTVKELLNKGADPCATEESGVTPLAWAYYSGYTCKDEIYRVLMNASFEVWKKGGSCPLMLYYAAHGGCNDIVKELLVKGYSVDSGYMNDTPLATAAMGGQRHKETVKILINSGADVDLAIEYLQELAAKNAPYLDSELNRRAYNNANRGAALLSQFKHRQIVPQTNVSQNITKEGLEPKRNNQKVSDYPKKSWAVIIGISKYQYSGPNGLTNLVFADDDAKAFSRSLRNLGWSDSHMKLLTNENATEKNIRIAIESWLTKAGPHDQVVLFWSGHGYPDPENPEKVYLACYDTDVSIPATGYRMDKVRDALEEIKAKNVVLLADTCHAGKLITRGQKGLSIVPNIEKMNREKNIPKGWIFMVGADTDRQAIEHTSWTNGAFTHSLIKGLSGEADGFQSVGAKDNVVTMAELRAYMNTAMPDETQKVLGVAKRPVITTSTGDPDIWNLTLQAE